METWTLIAVLLAVAIGVSSAATPCKDACFCATGTIADCDGRDLRQPPAGNWLTTERLLLNDNDIAVLYKTSFTGYARVITLQISRNALTEVELEFFTTMPNLRNLTLSHNRIRSLEPATAAVPLKSLTELDLSGNSLTSLDPDVLKTAPKLLSLMLSQNPLVLLDGQPLLIHPTLELLQAQFGQPQRLVPESFAKLPLLREALLVGARVTDVAGAFAFNPRLATLDLRHNDITQLQGGTFVPGTALRKLWLSNNPLGRLDIASLADSVPTGGSIWIDETPLACSCAYEGLHWWARGKGVTLSAVCNTVVCPFSMQMH